MLNRIMDVFGSSRRCSIVASNYRFSDTSHAGRRPRVAPQTRRSRLFSVLRIAAVVLLLGMMDLAAALDINAADAEQIAQGLKGVGLKKAQAIVDYRNANGQFGSLDDLLKVKGVGKKLLQLNASNISFSTTKGKAVDKSASRQ